MEYVIAVIIIGVLTIMFSGIISFVMCLVAIKTSNRSLATIVDRCKDREVFFEEWKKENPKI